MINAKRILVLAPHADDESLGCAGWLSSLSAVPGVEIQVDLVTDSTVDIHQGRRALPGYDPDEVVNQVLGGERIEEFKSACNLMNVGNRRFYGYRTRFAQIGEIIPSIEKSLNEFRPDTLLFPGISFHQDHYNVFRAAMAALRPRNAPSIKNALCYETTNYSWQAPGEEFLPNLYFELTEDQLAKKLSVCAEYATQRLDTVGGQEEIRRLAVKRGAELHPLPHWVTPHEHSTAVPYAEAYRLIRARF